MKVQPYLFFEGRCEEALQFYRSAIGAEIGMLMRFRESPKPSKMPLPSGSDDKIMHADFKVGGTQLLTSDGLCSGKSRLAGTSLALEAAAAASAERLFKALVEGGDVQLPIGKTFFSPAFGAITDRFGLTWMVMAAPSDATS